MRLAFRNSIPLRNVSIIQWRLLQKKPSLHLLYAPDVAFILFLCTYYEHLWAFLNSDGAKDIFRTICIDYIFWVVFKAFETSNDSSVDGKSCHDFIQFYAHMLQLKDAVTTN